MQPVVAVAPELVRVRHEPEAAPALRALRFRRLGSDLKRVAEQRDSSEDKYRMLFEAGKTVPAKPAVDTDIMPGITEQTGAKPIPLTLTDTAGRQGYSALYRGAETTYFDAPLRDYLRQSIYGGRCCSGQAHLVRGSADPGDPCEFDFEAGSRGESLARRP